MRIRVTPEQEMIEAHRKARASRAPRSPKKEFVGAEVVEALLDQRLVIYRGRKYRIPPLSFEDGVRVSQVLDTLRLTASGSPSMEEVRALLRSAEDLCRVIYRPTGWARLWAWLVHPFRGASPREVGELLGFLWMCQRVDVTESRLTIPTRGNGTYLRISEGSRITFPAGSTPVVSR
jgi:hypothetical protein